MKKLKELGSLLKNKTVQTAAKAFLRMKKSDKGQIMMFVGMAAITWGVGLIFIPAGFIVGGAILLVAGYHWESGGD